MTDWREDLTGIPYGRLGIIPMPGCLEFAKKIDRYIIDWRNAQDQEYKDSIIFDGYWKDSFLMDVSCPRFGTGEGKATICESVRGVDIFIICDCFNYGVTHKMYGIEFPTSPDEHFANLKRVISATAGKARRITVIMPMLYEGRQHKRSSRESLDCALALQELTSLGVNNIITFDAHDARVQNAIPSSGFENVSPVYQMIKALVRNADGLKVDPEHLMIVSPDEGGMSRCIYYATVLGVELGMFYKRRDYSKIVDGRNPILAHEFLGDNVDGKDVIVVDDMISSGDSMIDVARQLKARNAKRIFICTSFGLFCNGLERFDEAYEKGIFDKIFTTNLIYQTPELLSRPWYASVQMEKYCAHIINTVNNDRSLSPLLDPKGKIDDYLKKYGLR
ncbi:MAG: ribose-phosphate pyrophosphokinase [Clostridia bacterium]|nr:ribose-phosphate pyrophosphokinase [Clostridia bacterium]